MLFFLHHCELPSLDFGEHRVNPAPVNIHLPQPQPPPADDPRVPEGENLPPPLEDPQNVQMSVDQASTSLGAEEQNESTLLRPQLHRIYDDASDSVNPGTSIDPSQESNYQSGQSHPLTDEELRKVRLQHFENKRD